MQPAHSTVCAAVSQMRWKSFWTIPKDFHFKRVFFASAFNLPYEGGGCKFCPDAKPDDDLLDFIVIANVPKIIALAILPTVFPESILDFQAYISSAVKKQKYTQK